MVVYTASQPFRSRNWGAEHLRMQASTLGEIQPFRYRGYVYDVETGLYYLRSRYFLPYRVRFLNADSIIETENLFAYCNNDSINCSDETGEATIKEAQTRVWKRPKEKSGLVDRLKEGTEVTVLFSVNKDDVLWCYISYNRGSVRGYVKGSMLSDTNIEYAKPEQMDVNSLFGPKKKVIKWGSTGVYVYNMQLVLYCLGFLDSINDCDGIYKSKTKDALENFQSANYIHCDGRGGEETKDTMMKEKLRNHNHELTNNTALSNMVIYH